MNGAPIEGANVTFLNDTFAGFARTDASGRYRLVQGALPGTNKIVISKTGRRRRVHCLRLEIRHRNPKWMPAKLTLPRWELG